MVGQPEVMGEFGVYTYRELRAAGRSRRGIEEALGTGELRRLRRSWYAVKEADAQVVAAVAGGGVLSCVSALRRHQVWVPEADPESPERVHTRGNSQAHRRRSDLCTQHGRPEPEVSAVDQVPIALRHAVRCVNDETFVVLCDSVLNRGLMTRSALTGMFQAAPPPVGRLLNLVDAGAQSGLETMGRLRLKAMGLRVRTQVQIPGIGRVDALVGDRLIVEFDGRTHHSDQESFAGDRRRDRVAVVNGYLVLRLTYADVVRGWPAVARDIRRLVEQSAHLWP
ncbi:endonuclease domain-containing protein [Gordonia hirsuta]|uniref:endonuclease domain-containing protein n=1 Tax=Gordonia hirsuta TaxID=53427 RepID=UPI00138B0EF9|nr:DUF559 domain-containing protein [Gordonia hirsuta]